MDFGLAHVMDEKSVALTRSFVGSPSYASPEQISGSRVLDGRKDVYSLGVTLYQCLTGRMPFQSDSVGGLFQRILRDEPPPLRRLHPSIPRELEVVTLKAMEKDRDRRYPSAGAFANDL